MLNESEVWNFHRFAHKIGYHSNVPLVIGKRMSDRSSEIMSPPILKIWWRLVQYILRLTGLRGDR